MKNSAKVIPLLEETLPEPIPFSERPEVKLQYEWHQHLRTTVERLKLLVDNQLISETLRVNEKHNRRDDLLDRRQRNLKRLSDIPAIPADYALPEGVPASSVEALTALRLLDAPLALGENMMRRVRVVLELAEVAFWDHEVILTQLRQDLSTTESRKLRSEHERRMLARYRASQALARAFTEERELWGLLPRFGYDVNQSELPSPSMRAVLMLGHETDPVSEITDFRRFLEERGVLPGPA